MPESTQRHTHVRLKQIELALFTLCDGSFVFCDMTSEISVQVYGTTSDYKGRIGPVVGISLSVGYTLVVSPKESSQRKRYTEEQGCRMLDWVNMTTTYCDGVVKQRERESERESLFFSQKSSHLDFKFI